MHRHSDTSPLPRPQVSFDHRDLQALETYWQGMRSASEVPDRANLDPGKIQAVLPNTFILQRVAFGTARFRMAGQQIRDFLRLDPRGMPFSTLFDRGDHDDLRALLEGAFHDPAIVGLPLRAGGGGLRPALDGALLLLPLRDGQGDTTRILGALVTPENHSHKPRRFSIRTDLRTRYERLGTIDPRLSWLETPRKAPQKRPDVAKRPALQLVVNNG